MANFAILETDNSNRELLKETEEFLKVPIVTKAESHVQFYLKVNEDRLQLAKIPGPHPIEVDFLSAKWKFKIQTLSKSQPLFKAIGLSAEPLSLFDSTLGLGEDTFCFLSKGCSVTAIEKNPIIYLLAKNGFDRLKKNNQQNKKWGILSEKLNLIFGDAAEYMATTKNKFDVVYIDPMYTEKNQDAEPKKEMQFLRELIQPEDNVEQLFFQAMKLATSRVVIKRPLRSNYLSLAPTHSFKGRSTRYDMYKVSSR